MPALLCFRDGSFMWETSGIVEGTVATLYLSGPQRNPWYVDSDTPKLISAADYATRVRSLLPTIVGDVEMALQFAGGTYYGGGVLYTGGAFLTVTALPVSAYPFTFACWANPVAAATKYTPCMSLNLPTSTTVSIILSCFLGKAYLQLTNTGGNNTISSNSVTDGAWNFIAAVCRSATDRSVYLGNTRTNGDGNSVAFPSGLTTYQVAGEYRAGQNTAEATLAEPCVWNVALADAELAYLAAGNSPEHVQNSAIKHYSRLKRYSAPVVDLYGTNDLTKTSTPTPSNATHPTISYKSHLLLPVGWNGGVSA